MRYSLSQHLFRYRRECIRTYYGTEYQRKEKAHQLVRELIKNIRNLEKTP